MAGMGEVDTCIEFRRDDFIAPQTLSRCQPSWYGTCLYGNAIAALLSPSRPAHVCRANLGCQGCSAASVHSGKPALAHFFLRSPRNPCTCLGCQSRKTLFHLNSRKIGDLRTPTSSVICDWFKPAFFKPEICYRCSLASCL